MPEGEYTISSIKLPSVFSMTVLTVPSESIKYLPIFSLSAAKLASDCFSFNEIGTLPNAFELH